MSVREIVMITAVIPAYNEERTIREVITRCKEINVVPLVIDDGSTDRTYEIARKLCATIHHKENLGKGMALRTAFKFIEEEAEKGLEPTHVVIIDGDLQYDPYEILSLSSILSMGYDYVVGERYWSGVPFRHRLGNWLWIGMFNFLFGTNLTDTNCGFVAMRFEVMKRLKVHSGYIVDNDILIQVVRMGYKIANFPVTVRYNHTKEIFSGIRMVLGILLFMIKRKVGEQYVDS